MSVKKKFKVKKGDQVTIIAGKDKGKSGEITKVDLQNDRVTVQGLNLAKRHQKPSAGSEGGIINKELPIHVSNVAHLDPKDGKATRIGYRIEKDGKKVRYAKRSGEVIN